MKIVKLLFVFLAFSVNSQVLFTGNHVIEPYYGFPNVSKYLPILSLGEDPNNINKFRGLSPSGFRYSYMLADDISVGVDFIYSRNVMEYVTTDTVFQNGNWQYNSYEAKRNQTRLRVHARINFHLPIDQPNADSYIGIGFGTNSRWIKDFRKQATSTDPLNPNLDWVLQREVSGSDAILIPFSMRVYYGYRYYFSYNLGITGEIGVGGPLLSIGLTYKF